MSKPSGFPANNAPVLTDTVFGLQTSTTTDVQVTLANLATAITKSTLLSNPYKFSVYRSTAWTTTNGTFTLVPFDTKEFDTSSNVDIVTNKGRFTAPVAGFYHFSSRVNSTSINNGATVAIALYKNGSSIKVGGVIDAVYSPTSTRQGAVNVSATIQLAANDYVEVYYYGNAGPGITGQDGTYFDGFLVSAT